MTLRFHCFHGVLSPLFCFVSLIFSCIKSNIICHNAFECANKIVNATSSSSSSLQCYGYASCFNCPLIESDYDGIISCYGSYSCANSSIIQRITNNSVDQAIQCYGFMSCSNVNIIYNNYGNVGCFSDRSCMNVKNITTITGNIQCIGDHSCSNSIIFSGGHVILYGTYAVENSIIQMTKDNMDIRFHSSYSGNNATLICENGFKCNIECYGNGCNNIIYYCGNYVNNNYILYDFNDTNNNNCTFNGDSCAYSEKNELCVNSNAYDMNEIYQYYKNLDDYFLYGIEAAHVDTSTNAFMNHGSYNVNDSFICDDYYECGYDNSNNNNASLNNVNNSIYCSAYDACHSAINVNTDNGIIRCDGYDACVNVENVITTYDSGDIYMTGTMSTDAFIYNKNLQAIINAGSNNNVYCTSFNSCCYKSIENSKNVYCNAHTACANSTIHNISNSVFGYAIASLRYSTIYNVNNNIYCSSRAGCINMTIYNVGGSIYTWGYAMMRYSNINNVKNNVLGLGTRCFDYSKISNIDGSVIGIGTYAFSESTITNASKFICGSTGCAWKAAIIGIRNLIYINGGYGISNGEIISGDIDTTITIEIHGTQTSGYSVFCNETDICKIDCGTQQACKLMNLYCIGECWVSCNQDNGYYCPTLAMENTSYILWYKNDSNAWIYDNYATTKATSNSYSTVSDDDDGDGSNAWIYDNYTTSAVSDDNDDDKSNDGSSSSSISDSKLYDIIEIFFICWMITTIGSYCIYMIFKNVWSFKIHFDNKKREKIRNKKRQKDKETSKTPPNKDDNENAKNENENKNSNETKNEEKEEAKLESAARTRKDKPNRICKMFRCCAICHKNNNKKDEHNNNNNKKRRKQKITIHEREVEFVQNIFYGDSNQSNNFLGNSNKYQMKQYQSDEDTDNNIYIDNKDVIELETKNDATNENENQDNKNSKMEKEILSSNEIEFAIQDLIHESKLSYIFTCQTLTKHSNFIVSLFIVAVCLILSFVCGLYGFGQILELELANYWCDKKELSEIYQHSYQYGLNQGTSDGCWRSKQFTVDESSLFDSISSYTTTPNMTLWNIFIAFLWFINCWIFLYLSVDIILTYLVAFGFITLNYAQTTNTKKMTKMMNDKKNENKEDKTSIERCLPCLTAQQPANGPQRRSPIVAVMKSCCFCTRLLKKKNKNEQIKSVVPKPSLKKRYCNCFSWVNKDNGKLNAMADKYFWYVDWFKYYFGEDTRLWFLSLVLREMQEIILQFIVFVNYNGINLWNRNELVLAYRPSQVLLFSILLSINSILFGFFWLFYLLTSDKCLDNIVNKIKCCKNKNEKNKSQESNNFQCRGQFFKQLVFLADTVFDIFYALFPIMVVISEIGFNLTVAVGTLQISNFISFLGTFLPMMFLVGKCGFRLYLYRVKLLNEVRTHVKQERVKNIKLKAAKFIKKEKETKTDIGNNDNNDSDNDGNNDNNHNNEANTLTQQRSSQVINSKLNAITPNDTNKDTSVESSMTNTRESKNNDNDTEKADKATTQRRFSHQPLISEKEGHYFLASKIIVGICSFIFIAMGLTCMIYTMTFLNDTSEICSNPSKNQLTNHPELNFWDECEYKTNPFVWYDDSSKLSCNCREAQIDMSTFSSNEDVTSMIESMLIYWDMLEILAITDDSSRFEINLTDSSHYNAKYLKVLHLKAITVKSLSESIENWNNLEYFYVTKVHWPQWPNNFNQLNKMSYLYLWDIKYLSSSILPPSICDMTNLRAINVFESLTSEYNYNREIPDCITSLNKLQSIIIYFSNIKSFPFDLLTMDSINEIGYLSTNISLRSMMASVNITTNTYDYHTIDDDYSEWWDFTFDYNSIDQTTYYFTGSDICDEWYNEVLRTGFPDSWIKFLNESGGCDYVCDDYAVFVCSPFDWQNGVCDDTCNSESCYYDGGDCNQICLYSYQNCSIYDMFDNNECNIECNNTYCDYDSYECVTNTATLLASLNYNETYCNDNNNNNNNSRYNVYNSSISSDDISDLCKLSWIEDGWCDSNCQEYESCAYDGNDCNCDNTDDNNCYRVYQLVSAFDSSITVETLCNYWETVTAMISVIIMDVSWFSDSNCTSAFNYMDLDDSGDININEMVYGVRDLWNLTETKALQINCSVCTASDYGF